MKWYLNGKKKTKGNFRIEKVVEIMTIKELRKQTGMTQKQFADYFEIPHRTVQNWEGNVNKCPEYLLKLMEHRLKNESKETHLPSVIHNRNKDMKSLHKMAEKIQQERLEVLRKRTYINPKRKTTE